MFFLRQKKRDRQVSIRSIVMEHFRSRIQDVLTSEENFQWWRFLFVKRSSKNILNFKDEKDIKTDDLDTNTQQNATEGRVLYMIFIA